MTGYQVPAQPVEVEQVIRRSRFITRLRCTPSVEQARALIREINAQYPQATHHCWAYIVGNPFITTLMACSDAGEPAGTAGRPMLNSLREANVGDITAVCTRYFGGIKLGTGGLARAYGSSVKLAMESLTTELKIERSLLRLQTDYKTLTDLQYLLKEFDAIEGNIDYGAGVNLDVAVATSDLETFVERIATRFSGRVVCTLR